MPVSTSTVVIVSAIGGAGTFLASLHYAVRAYVNRTGPNIAGANGKAAYMKDFSGHFEMDLLPVFVNLVTSMAYLGEVIETYEKRRGFFNTYRYCSYLFTCPLMVYEM